MSKISDDVVVEIDMKITPKMQAIYDYYKNLMPNGYAYKIEELMSLVHLDTADHATLDKLSGLTGRKDMGLQHHPGGDAFTESELHAWLQQAGASNIVAAVRPGSITVTFDVGCGCGTLLTALNAYVCDRMALGVQMNVRCRNTYTGWVTTVMLPNGIR
jgi:hypothetical protein